MAGRKVFAVAREIKDTKLLVFYRIIDAAIKLHPEKAEVLRQLKLAVYQRGKFIAKADGMNRQVLIQEIAFGLLNFTMDEIAFVIAHEIAHIIHEDHLNITANNKAELIRLINNHEINADKEAKAIMLEAGFNPLAADSALNKMLAFDFKGGFQELESDTSLEREAGFYASLKPEELRVLIEGQLARLQSPDTRYNKLLLQPGVEGVQFIINVNVPYKVEFGAAVFEKVSLPAYIIHLINKVWSTMVGKVAIIAILLDQATKLIVKTFFQEAVFFHNPVAEGAEGYFSSISLSQTDLLLKVILLVVALALFTYFVNKVKAAKLKMLASVAIGLLFANVVQLVEAAFTPIANFIPAHTYMILYFGDAYWGKATISDFCITLGLALGVVSLVWFIARELPQALRLRQHKTEARQGENRRFVYRAARALGLAAILAAIVEAITFVFATPAFAAGATTVSTSLNPVICALVVIGAVAAAGTVMVMSAKKNRAKKSNRRTDIKIGKLEKRPPYPNGKITIGGGKITKGGFAKTYKPKVTHFPCYAGVILSAAAAAG
ncbi:MAG: hypothetical protein WC301_07860, partial [Candidatus Omnitrophota bacterium]